MSSKSFLHLSTLIFRIYVTQLNKLVANFIDLRYLTQKRFVEQTPQASSRVHKSLSMTVNGIIDWAAKLIWIDALSGRGFLYNYAAPLGMKLKSNMIGNWIQKLFLR